MEGEMDSESQLPANLLGFLFTNDKSLVVFADKDFRSLIRSPVDDSLVGVALHDALGLEKRVASDFVEEVREVGSVEKRHLELRDRTGDSLDVLARSWASYDEQESFEGVRIFVRQLLGDDLHQAQMPVTEAVNNAGAWQIVSKVDHLDDEALLELYFNAHVEELQVMVARVLGLFMRDKLESNVNKFAEQNGWAINMRDGQIAVDQRDTEAYRAILTSAIDYVGSLVGYGIVAPRLRSVDEQMDARTLELATQVGLRMYPED